MHDVVAALGQVDVLARQQPAVRQQVDLRPGVLARFDRDASPRTSRPRGRTPASRPDGPAPRARTAAPSGTTWIGTPAALATRACSIAFPVFSLPSESDHDLAGHRARQRRQRQADRPRDVGLAAVDDRGDRADLPGACSAAARRTAAAPNAMIAARSRSVMPAVASRRNASCRSRIGRRDAVRDVHQERDGLLVGPPDDARPSQPQDHQRGHEQAAPRAPAGAAVRGRWVRLTRSISQKAGRTSSR